MKKLLTMMVLLAAWAPLASAQSSDIDYVGFGWEDGGIPASNPGDKLSILAVATLLDPIFGVDLLAEEVTIYIWDLASGGQVNVGGTLEIGYNNGMIEVWRDPSKDRDWGTNPPNAAFIDTFRHLGAGTKMFEGEFSSFNLQINPTFGFGSYQGLIDGIGGTIAESCVDCVFTFGGAFTDDIAQVPEGYHLQIDGVLQVENDVATHESSWGAVKALFKN